MSDESMPRLIKINEQAKSIQIYVKMPDAETQEKLKKELEKNYPGYTVFQRKDND